MNTLIPLLLALTSCLLGIVLAYHSPRIAHRRQGFSLDALKFDPADIITVKLRRPLGLSLEENIENEARGVFVSEVKEGSAKASGKVYKGLYLIQGEDAHLTASPR